MPTVSQLLAEFSSKVTFADLPPEVVAAVQRFVYDAVGCAFGGVRTPEYAIADEVDRSLGGESQCRIIGSGRMASVTSAAFLNSLAVRALNFNDVYWSQDPCHPSDILPGVWACAELVDAEGEDVILAIALAYELEARLCECAFPGIRERGWHHATLTAFASAYACSRALGLSVEQTVDALGIAGACQGTLGCVTTGELGMMKATVDPLATEAGARAALLARAGYTGPAHVFCGPGGLADAFGPEWRLERLTDGLGESWRILRCAVKAYPTEALIQAPIECVLAICAAQGLAAEDVAEVRIETLERVAASLSDPSKYDPHTHETADHSLPYCIAAALVHGRVTPDLFAPEAIADPRVRAHLAKVVVVGNAEFEAGFPEVQRCRVTLVTTGGESHQREVDYAAGDPRRPLAQERVDAKFDAMCGDEVPPAQRQEIRDAIAELAEVPARRFMELLAFRG